MSSDLAVEKDAAREQGDLAPQASRPLIVRDSVPSSIEATQLAGVGHAQRKRSGGELLFDATAYGGFALVGNEVTSTYIVKQAGKDNLLGRAMVKGDELSKQFGPKSSKYFQHGRFNYITFAVLGGMVMVPFIKGLEDNKGKLVRFADRIIHGKRAETDPTMVRAHKEMDESPKQTWGSLWKGRVLTVAAAYGVDSTIGWENSLLSRALKGTKLDRYRSFDHIGERAADALTPKLSGMMKIEATKMHGWLNQGFGLLTLSTALTVLFYVSSKLFASRSEQKREEREILREHRAEHPVTHPVHMDQLERSDAPGTSVSAVEAQSRLATPEHAVGV